jgi:cyclophilin family peptidyl-prolyl cis-trans isomerase
MRRQSTKIWKYLKNLVRPTNSRRPLTRRWRPCLEAFEDRFVPSTLGNMNAGAISGQVFLDANGNNRFDAGEFALPGVQITLSGTTNSNQAVSLSTSTDANGNYSFQQVQPGTYQLSRGNIDIAVSNPVIAGGLGGTPVGQSITAITLAPGQIALNNNFTVRGVAPQGISLAQFLTTSVPSPFGSQTPGSGQAFADGMSQYAGVLPGGTGTLGGSVINSANTAGIGGAQVVLSGLDNFGNSILKTTTTAANGSYQFSNLNAGEYTLSVPQQPTGFRAGLPSAGTLGGISPHNNQITGIVVGNNPVTDNTYNFGEIPLPTPTGANGLTAGLADDTGASANDGITSDAVIEGNVSGSPTSLVASFDNSAATVNVLNQVTPGGGFVLNTGLLRQIAGGNLTDGSHTLHLTATGAQGSSTVNVAFTLLTVTPSQPTADFTTSEKLGSDLATNVHVGNVSASGTYTIAGTATPGTTVALLGVGRTLTATPDASGNYSFTGVPLFAGANRLTIVALDKAGNTSAPLATDFIIAGSPTLVTIPAQSVTAGQSTSVNLFSSFPYPAADTVVQLNTNMGPINVELFNRIAPNTVANFLNFANTTVPGFAASTYNNTFFTRLISNFILQGGGLVYNPATNTFKNNSGTAIPSEHNLSGAELNVIGTLAMALPSNADGTTNTNGASSEYFVNLVNNPSLDAQGFTVFGRIADPESMRIVNTVAALPTQSESTFGGSQNPPLVSDLANLPLKNFTGTFPNGLTTNNLAFINSITSVQPSPKLTFKVTGNDPTIALVSVDSNNQLTIQGIKAGTTTATITASDGITPPRSTQITITIQ